MRNDTISMLLMLIAAVALLFAPGCATGDYHKKEEPSGKSESPDATGILDENTLFERYKKGSPQARMLLDDLGEKKKGGYARIVWLMERCATMGIGQNEFTSELLSYGDDIWPVLECQFYEKGDGAGEGHYLRSRAILLLIEHQYAMTGKIPKGAYLVFVAAHDWKKAVRIHAKELIQKMTELTPEEEAQDDLW